MGLINKFIDNISKIEELAKFKPFEVHINTPRHNFTEEKQILENVIKGKDRLTEAGHVSKLTIQVYSKEIQRFIFSATLQEFPFCCGKLMMYSIKLLNVSYYNDSIIKWSNRTGSLLMTDILELVKDISDVLHYSSVDFIISNVEQPFLLTSVRDIGLKEVSSFQNRRNHYKHTCYNFTVNFPKTTEFKDLSVIDQTVAQ